MQKSLVLFTLLLIGTLSTSAIFNDRIQGKWFVKYAKMKGQEQAFNNELEAPWMEFKNDDILLLGEPGSEKSKEAKWTYDKALGILHFNEFGDGLDFKTTEFTDSTLVIKAHNGLENVIILNLVRHF